MCARRSLFTLPPKGLQTKSGARVNERSPLSHAPTWLLWLLVRAPRAAKRQERRGPRPKRAQGPQSTKKPSLCSSIKEQLHRSAAPYSLAAGRNLVHHARRGDSAPPRAPSLGPGHWTRPRWGHGATMVPPWYRCGGATLVWRGRGIGALCHVPRCRGSPECDRTALLGV